jgi:rubrerythrin
LNEHGEEFLLMTDEEARGVGGERPDPEGRGEADEINWACTVCGYRVEGELPERCPDCGSARENFEIVPIPGY